MTYVQRVLQPDETLVYSTTLHWFVYWRAVLFAIAALALLIGSRFVPRAGACGGDRIACGGRRRWTRHAVVLALGVH